MYASFHSGRGIGRGVLDLCGEEVVGDRNPAAIAQHSGADAGCGRGDRRAAGPDGAQGPPSRGQQLGGLTRDRRQKRVYAAPLAGRTPHAHHRRDHRKDEHHRGDVQLPQRQQAPLSAFDEIMQQLAAERECEHEAEDIERHGYRPPHFEQRVALRASAPCTRHRSDPRCCVDPRLVRCGNRVYGARRRIAG